MSSTQIIECNSEHASLGAPIMAFVLTAFVLGVMQCFLPMPMLLLERYFPGWGWLQIILMSFYAALLTRNFLKPKMAAYLRPRIWLFFSLMFFAQFFLGLAGFKEMLMTGKLHLPVPALIIAGPLFRGRDFFMPILFILTAFLVGPAWCSHLCYIGAWDDMCSRRSKVRTELPGYASKIRLMLLVFVVATALILRFLQADWLSALIAGAIFGVIGLAVMLIVSSRNGTMTHCVSYCPIGLIGNWLGRLSPFRMQIGDKCNECQLCRKSCRYNAMNSNNIKNRRPGSTCTLCGDCVSACNSKQITYVFPFLSEQTSRAAFIVMIISLHTIFLAVARI